MCCLSEHAKDALPWDAHARDNRRRHLLTMSFETRRCARDTSIVVRHVTLGRVRKAGWNIFISGSAVTKEEQALKASTTAKYTEIKERSAINFRASTTILLTRNLQQARDLLIITGYATHSHLIIVLFRNKLADSLYLRHILTIK